MISAPHSYNRLWTALAVAAFLAGVFFRFWDLGGAPLAVDEYFLGTSALNTAEKWLPEFDCGGYYTRGLLIQYLTVPLLWLGNSLELSIRFWPAVASLLTVAAVWRIGRFAGGIATAAIAVTLVSLSLWEVEFGRFGRMYAPFQALFVWYAYFQMRHLIEGHEASRWWYLGVSGLAIFTFEGAALLLALNFLPIVYPERRWSTSHIAAAVGLLLAGIIDQRIDFRRLGASVPQTPSVAEVSTAPTIALPIDLPTIPDLIWPVIVMAIISGVGLLVRLRPIRAGHPSVIYWLATIVVLSLGMIGFGTALLAAAYLLRLPLPTRSASPGIVWVSTYVIAAAATWTAVLTICFWLSGAPGDSAVKQALHYVANYPDVFRSLVQPWVQTIPVTTLAMSALTLPVVLTAIRGSLPRDSTEAIRYLVAVLILLVLVVGILRQPYAITRYTYFLYPLVLVLAARGTTLAAEWLTQNPLARTGFVLTTVTALFAFAEDFRLDHLLHINEQRFRYRLAYGDKLGGHYYPRWDFRSTAEYVNVRLAPEDRVIVFEQPLPHYLERTDALFVPYGTSIYWMIWGCDGQRDLWSNVPLLGTKKDVEELIAETAGTVWLVMRSAKVPWRNSVEAQLASAYDNTPAFTSPDGHLVVYRASSSQTHQLEQRTPQETIRATP